MKHLKIFEGKTDKSYVIILMQAGIPEEIFIFDDEDSAKNVLINTIHYNAKEEEGEDYGCKNIFDLNELINYWNNSGVNGSRLYEKGDEIYFFEKEIEKQKYELDSELQIRKDTNKYNL